MSDLLSRVTAFRVAFARRQAAELVDLPGAFAVRDPAFRLSQEHNQLIVAGSAAGPTGLPEPAELPGLAERGLGPRRRYRVNVLDGPFGERAAPVLEAAGFARDTELVLARETAGCALPGPAAASAELAELCAAVHAQQLRWFGDEELSRQLTERRAVRLAGAEEVRFLAVRDPGSGEVAAWADLYLDRAAGLAQLEDLVTAEPHQGKGYGERLLATGLALAERAGIPWFFLLADAADWPHAWYRRRGFREIGRSHTFLSS
ncbi:GNAT family N-acetyltransferase [Kitasatospora viridis]|uniref:Acetyltransferase (GNAT) family protein n=1 Tax=Kitasatospora viridis TaxID=281105 RepID=A0A561UH51_9ACTN|nr:GNAT family N-acetyltransferase [Kitasatospora viridis]TWF98698.1 acetyltransferase (GNAT) family protein [Kitasatospora viridis]